MHRATLPLAQWTGRQAQHRGCRILASRRAGRRGIEGTCAICLSEMTRKKVFGLRSNEKVRMGRVIHELTHDGAGLDHDRGKIQICYVAGYEENAVLDGFSLILLFLTYPSNAPDWLAAPDAPQCPGSGWRPRCLLINGWCLAETRCGSSHEGSPNSNVPRPSVPGVKASSSRLTS